MYCQDNETSWFDWTLAIRHAGARRFLKLFIGRSLMRDLYPEGHPVSLNRLLAAANKTCGTASKLGQPGMDRLVAQRGTLRRRPEREALLARDPDRIGKLEF